MRILFIICILFLSQFPWAMAHAEEAAPSVRLHLRHKQAELTGQARQQLCREAVHLVESSNFHSGSGDTHRIFTPSGLQRDFSRETMGEFLHVSFPAPRKIKTPGGELTVTGIVVGLNRDEYASSLFTFDESKEVVGHAKYAGERCIQIYKTVRKLTGED